MWCSASKMISFLRIFQFLVFYSFRDLTFVHRSIVFMLQLLLWKKLTRWVMSVKVTLDDEEVRWWWYETRARACESAWCVCDTHGKFQPLGISGAERSRGKGPLRCPTVGTFRVYHTHTKHFRTLLLLSCTITISLPHRQASPWRSSLT